MSTSSKANSGNSLSPASHIIGWYLATWLSTYANTNFINVFHDATSLTLIRFFSSMIFGFFTNPTSIWTKKNVYSVLPVAICLLCANQFNSLSLGLCGISLTYVVKATIPVLTLLTCLLRGEKLNYYVIPSVIVTVSGVMIAAAADLGFVLMGFLAALSSSISQTIMNVNSKESMKETQLTGPEMQFMMVTICSAILTPIYIVSNLETLNISGVLELNFDEILACILTAVAYHTEYVLNFAIIPRISKLTFSLSDNIRRLSIIYFGSIMFSKSLNTMQFVGTCVAFIGVMSYTATENSGMSTTVRTSIIGESEKLMKVE